jgi:hypothetical protein
MIETDYEPLNAEARAFAALQRQANDQDWLLKPSRPWPRGAESAGRLEDRQPATGFVNGVALGLAFWCGITTAVIAIEWVLPLLRSHG